MSSYSLLAKAIISTVAYHDIHNYPLKESEIWRWLYFGWPVIESRPATIDKEEFFSTLNDLLARRKLETKGGYYYLYGREPLVLLRLERNELARKKWEIALRGAKILRTAPFVKLIAVCNTLAINNVKRDSDIDFFIVTEDDRLWTNRFAVTGALEARDLRRHGNKVSDRICLSFYLTKGAIDFRPIMLHQADPYFAFWIAQLVPLYDNGGWQSLIHNNHWLENIMPNALADPLKPRIQDNQWTWGLRSAREFFLNNWFGDKIEKYLRQVQQFKMKSNAGSVADEPDNRVMISKSVLKFHEKDRREEYREKFRQRLEGVLR
ncbi:MAG: hypothetical protein V1838_03960 [Patescibacteria group bacterium]